MIHMPPQHHEEGSASLMGILAPELVPLPQDVVTPSSWRGSVSCSNDCETCPLYIKGCAQECVRWPDLICARCPCLGSAYVRWLMAAPRALRLDGHPNGSLE